MRDARFLCPCCIIATIKRPNALCGALGTPLGAKTPRTWLEFGGEVQRTRRELSDSAAGVALRNRWRRQATAGELSLKASSRSCSRGAVQPFSTVQPCAVTARVLL